MSMVPYTAGEVNPWVAAASFAMQHKDEIAAAAKKFSRKFKSSRQSKKAKKKSPPQAKYIGKPASAVTSTKLWTGTDLDPTTLDSRTLYQQEITDIPKDLGNNDIDSRQREQVFLQGFKVMMSVENTTTKPVHFNVAVVMNRRDPDGNIGTTDFFKGSGLDRGINFSNALNSNDFRSRPLNPDKFAILTHKRFTLSNPQQATPVYEAGDKPSFTSIDFYMPVKRIITYNGDTGAANNRIWLVYWCDQFNTATTTLPQSNMLTHSLRIITRFKEPKVNY